ncbi:10178_t:CDS:2, partial [Dentiscutata heterogama]
MSSSLNNTVSDNVNNQISTDKYVKAMMIVCFFSTLSNATSFILPIWKIMKKNIRPTMDSFLVLNLIASNFFLCLGFMFNYNWLRFGVIETGAICSIQGFLINFGDVTSGFWILVLCIYMYMPARYDCSRLVIISMIIIWPLNLIISLLGLAIQTPNSPFYDATHSSWCWISYNYKTSRIGFNYFITLAITIIVIILLAILYCRLKKNSQYVNKILIWYPLAYIILVVPLNIHRFAAMIDYELPFVYNTSTSTPPQRPPTPIYGIRRPPPINGIQRPLSPFSPTTSSRMLLSSPSPTRTNFSTPPITPNTINFPVQLSPNTATFPAPLSPNTATFPAPLSPISFTNSPTRVSFNPSDRYRFSYPEKNDSSISPIPVKTTSKPVKSPELAKSDQSISNSNHTDKRNKPRPSTFGSLADIVSHSPLTKLQPEILIERD